MTNSTTLNSQKWPGGPAIVSPDVVVVPSNLLPHQGRDPVPSPKSNAPSKKAPLKAPLKAKASDLGLKDNNKIKGSKGK